MALLRRCLAQRLHARAACRIADGATVQQASTQQRSGAGPGDNAPHHHTAATPTYRRATRPCYAMAPGAAATATANTAIAAAVLPPLPTPAELLAQLPESTVGPDCPPPSLAALLRLFKQAHAMAIGYAAAHPEVANVHKLARRVAQNINYVESQLAAYGGGEDESAAAAALDGATATAAAGGGGGAGGGAAAAAAAAAGAEAAVVAGAPRSSGLDFDRVQGIINNLRGFASEIQAMYEAPGVCAVQKKFTARTPGLATGVSPTAGSHNNNGSSEYGSGSNGGNGGKETAGPEARNPPLPASVEVDVVAHNGHTWVEVKGGRSFRLGSNRWTQGLRQQVEAMLAAAAAPACAVRYRAPQVVVFCPYGADPEVSAELEAMGAHVAAGIGSLASLPAPHPPLTCTNLDTTTICALVSEVSHRSPDDEALVKWASRTSHWRDCLAAKRAARLLPELAPHMARPRVVAASTAVEQFERLLAEFGGPRETARWREEVLPRIQVYQLAPEKATGSEKGSSSSSGNSSGSGNDSRKEAESGDSRKGSSDKDSRRDGGGNGGSQQGPESRLLFVVPSAVAALRLARHQTDVFSLGLAQEAVTLTANAGAVRLLADRAVAVETATHRPVWLTGL